MEFGVFNSFWDNYPNHLPFLNLMESKDDPKEWNLKTSISKLYAILNSGAEQEISDGIKRMITNDNWRAHLVATISLLAINPEKRDGFIELLWDRLSRGSMVSPQIVVSLSIIDKDFISKAKDILDMNSNDSSERLYDEKARAAIDYLLNKTVDDSRNKDQGGAITKRWTERLTKLTNEGKIKAERF